MFDESSGEIINCLLGFVAANHPSVGVPEEPVEPNVIPAQLFSARVILKPSL